MCAPWPQHRSVADERRLPRDVLFGWLLGCGHPQLIPSADSVRSMQQDASAAASTARRRWAWRKASAARRPGGPETERLGRTGWRPWASRHRRALIVALTAVMVLTWMMMPVNVLPANRTHGDEPRRGLPRTGSVDPSTSSPTASRFHGAHNATDTSRPSEPGSVSMGAKGVASAEQHVASADAVVGREAVSGCPRGTYMDASRRKRAEAALAEHFQRSVHATTPSRAHRRTRVPT